jgi:hypothetical protein
VHRVRGTALVETAVTLSFTLLLLFAGLQMALIGYFQLQLDGATFFFTHEYASGSTDTAALNTALSPLFPSVPTTIAPIPYSPPTTDVAPNFTQWGTTTLRYGGASILRPQRLQATASMQVTSSAFGGSVSLSAGNVDARPVIANRDDDASGDDFNSSQADTNVIDPLKTDDQNVPPYYITLAFIWYCNDPTTPSWGVCQSRTLRSLGLAEYLKDDNYHSGHTGIDQHDAPFYLMKCHQQMFAGLSIALSLLPNLSPLATDLFDPTKNPVIKNIYSWDYMPVQPESFGSQIGREFPLSPQAGCP